MPTMTGDDLLPGEAPPEPETTEQFEANREADQARAERLAQRKREANVRAQQVARRGWRLEAEEAAAAQTKTETTQTPKAKTS